MHDQYNIVKLCVGCDSVQSLRERQAAREGAPRHVTRMWPKRAEEIVGRGSLYWVINGEIRCRQLIAGFTEVIGQDGIRRCAIELEKDIILTRPTLRRPFQGWRYLKASDAPDDLNDDTGDELPAEIESMLNAIGVG